VLLNENESNRRQRIMKNVRWSMSGVSMPVSHARALSVKQVSRREMSGNAPARQLRAVLLANAIWGCSFSRHSALGSDLLLWLPGCDFPKKRRFVPVAGKKASSAHERD
jgi:hypothetical protein